MKRRMPFLMGAVLVITLPLMGCNGEATATVPADEVPLVAEGKGVVVAEALVEPARWTEVRSPSDGGKVLDVAVEEGDLVSRGDLLVMIDPSDAELAVQQAQAALAQAEAQLAGLKAGARPEEIAVSQARLAVARAAVVEAEARRDRLSGGEARADIAQARAAVAAAEAEEKQAFYVHEWTMKCFTFEKGDVEHTICPALGRPEEGARYAWHASQDGLEAARAQLTAAQNQAATRLRDAKAAVAGAAAQEQALQADLDLQRAGSLPEQIAAAEADIGKAQASLQAAEAALADLSIHAPFDASVVEVSVEVGDSAAPGQVLVVLATLDQLQVRTKDLIELDVVRVAVDQPVTVTLDALHDTPLEGRVVRIDEQSEDYRGDVTYPVIIELLRGVQELRWGMTASVEIDVE
ncbi:MAG: HlyD family efflux transporter periplasmic adaptor subunit [Anaerolineae bacterium]|jgi:multidrug efflux pump subunit AcrA (membrane-fusion protein)